MRPRGWEDEPTPVTSIADPKRTMLEAELEIAKVTLRDVKQAWHEAQATIRKLQSDVRELEMANAQLRAALRKK